MRSGCGPLQFQFPRPRLPLFSFSGSPVGGGRSQRTSRPPGVTARACASHLREGDRGRGRGRGRGAQARQDIVTSGGAAGPGAGGVSRWRFPQGDARTPLPAARPPAASPPPPSLPQRAERGPAAGAEARGRRGACPRAGGGLPSAGRLGVAAGQCAAGRRRARGLYGGGSVGPGCPPLALGRRPLLWGLLQGADPHAAHLLRPGLAAAHQLPLPVHRGFHDAQRPPAGG